MKETTTAVTPEAAPTTLKAREILGTTERENYLYDDWYREGTSLTEFLEVVRAQDEITSYKKVFLNEVFLCSPEKHEIDSVVFRAFTRPNNVGKVCRKDNYDAFNAGFLYTEMLAQKACLLWLGSNAVPPMFARPKALRELMGCVGLSGPAIENQSRSRDAYVADLIAKTPDKKQVTLITRIEGDDTHSAEKVFSVRTGKYTPISVSEIEDVFNAIAECDMGAIKCVGWHVDHDFASIDIIFPEATKEFKELCGLREDVQAGVRFITSGTGYSCFTAREIWSVNGVVSEHSVVKNKHIGEWDTADFIKRVKENIFDEYSALPERLCDLFNCILVDSNIVKSAADLKKGETIISKCTRSLFKHIQIASAFKMKDDVDTASYKKDYVQQLTDKITEIFSIEIQKALAEGNEVEITAYDLALKIMELPSMVTGIPKSYMENFANLCGKAPYFPFKEGKEYLETKKHSLFEIA